MYDTYVYSAEQQHTSNNIDDSNIEAQLHNGAPAHKNTCHVPRAAIAKRNEQQHAAGTAHPGPDCCAVKSGATATPPSPRQLHSPAAAMAGNGPRTLVVMCVLLLVLALGVLGSTHRFYDILGVERSASPADIKRAFRRMALKLHPDKATDKQEAQRLFV